MTIDWIQLVILGVTAVAVLGFLAAAIWGFKQIYKIIKSFPALQLVMKTMMLDKWSACRERGYVTDTDVDAFMSMSALYHQLGANGVIDEVTKRFAALPTEDSLRQTNPLLWAKLMKASGKWVGDEEINMLDSARIKCATCSHKQGADNK